MQRASIPLEPQDAPAAASMQGRNVKQRLAQKLQTGIENSNSHYILSMLSIYA